MNSDSINTYLDYVSLHSGDVVPGDERKALVEVSPRGFHLRNPPKPHQLTEFITSEADLFQTIHMGTAIVDTDAWLLKIDGLVDRPLALNLRQLKSLPKTDFTSFHECYGSPIKPPDTNLWRIGNVTWTGVQLDLLLRLTGPHPEAQYVWSDGLENGSFFQAKDCDRYQKDLPLQDAVLPKCLVAYEMNHAPIGKERGGPVRLVVPGFYGTNSTKWLCRLSLQASRSPSPFTTIYYNEVDPKYEAEQRMRPCWHVEPNSFLFVTPSSEGVVQGPDIDIDGRAWGSVEIENVVISLQDKGHWAHVATVKASKRTENEWQYYSTRLNVQPGTYLIMAQAVDKAGCKQPISGRRNHAHIIEVLVT